MINLAVFELRDIIKYLIKITLLVAIIVGLTKYFSSFKTKLNIDKNSFLSCLDTVIPSIRSVNKKEQNTKNNIEPLKMALGVELGMMDSVEKNDNGETNSENSENLTGDMDIGNTTQESETDGELEEAKTGLETEVLKNNVPEKYTSEYNGVKIRNETDNIKLTKEMLVPEIDINTKNILIYHTHTCESYTPTENFKYEGKF